MITNDILEIINSNNLNGFHLSGGTDKASWHSYDETLSSVLSKYRDTSGSILEIGVQYGGSSLLWHEYLPKFKLVMIDIVNKISPIIRDKLLKDRYDFIEIDAYTEETLSLLANKYPLGFDIISEDGSHELESQEFVLKKYSKLLKPGGTLIIEDIQDINYIDQLLSSVEASEYSSLKVYDLREVKGRWDDILIVLTK